MGYAGFGHMNTHPAKVVFTDFLLRHTFHNIGAGNKHISRILHHQDKIRQCGRINSATGTRAHYRANLRNNSRCHGIAKKYLSISRQGTDSLLDTCATGIVQPDDRSSHLHRHVHHFADFPGMRLGQGTAKDREILRKDINQPFTNHTIARHYPITGKLLLLHAEIGTAMGYQLVQFDKRTFLQK